MPHTEHARIPAPPETTIPKPSTIMVRRPAPRVVADPRPSIPVFPNPTPQPIWRPPRINRRPPDGTVGRDIHPSTSVVEIFRSIDSRWHMPIAVALLQHMVAVLIPAVPIVELARSHDLEFRIGGQAPSHHHLPVAHPLRTPRREDLDVTC